MKKYTAKTLTLLLLALICVTSVFACGKDTDKDTKDEDIGKIENTTTLGQGETSFDFTVTGIDGNTKSYTIKTDKKTVGQALLELGLIAGDEGQYGLYVKTVDGVTVDYDKDKKYWAFYIDGEYASSGVDSTDIEEGKTYSFKVK